MFEGLCWLVLVLCVSGVIGAYTKYRDPFHPAVILLPMCGFIYVLMPIYLSKTGALYAYVTEPQAIWVEAIIIAGLLCLIAGLFRGSRVDPARMASRRQESYRPEVLRNGAYGLGAIGLLAWCYTVVNGGGFREVFGSSYGRGYSEIGYIREASYLMIVGLLLLFSPQAFLPKSKLWMTAVFAFTLPYLIQGFLGAQRGPTFLIIATLGLSWYMSRGRRPSLMMMVAGGAALGFLLLFLVMNRGAIYLGSHEELSTDVGGVLGPTEANEYIFGAGCMIASHQTGDYFWGKRYLAQLVVRPVPRQLWPDKYVDFGVPELEQNAGVAKSGLGPVMGWNEIPGAAAALVADVWVECSWLVLPVLFLIGYAYGRTWQNAVHISGPWNVQYTILALLSIYLVTQSGEAVIFRLVILSLPSWWVWRKARYA